MMNQTLLCRFNAACTRAPLVVVLGAAGVLGGCASASSSVVQGPLAVPAPMPVTYVERVPTGSIFQANNASVSTLFSSEKPPRNIGDTLKVDIAESMKGSAKVSTDTSRDNSFAVKGPGAASPVQGGLFRDIWNLDATASGNDAFKGDGTSAQELSFTGKIAVAVINVLPNGRLVVAGERTVAFNNGNQTLRFSGVVNPSDIGSGNVVASADVVNARLEVVGQGDVADTGSRNWMQRLMSKSLSIW